MGRGDHLHSGDGLAETLPAVDEQLFAIGLGFQCDGTIQNFLASATHDGYR